MKSDIVRKGKSLEEFLHYISEGDVKLSVPDLNGEFWIDIRSHLVRRVLVNGYYEPHVTKAIMSNLSGDFIDVGANVGFFSIHVAKQPAFQGKVLALEPNLRANDFLQKNIAHNRVSEMVLPLKVAASSSRGEIEMSVVDGLEEYSTIANTRHPGVEGKKETKIVVETITMDELVNTHQLKPGLIKVDAEGAEMDVFRGMVNTLKIHKPTLICEIGDSTFGTDSGDVGKFFDDAGYSVFTLTGEAINIHEQAISEIIARPNS